MELISAVFCVWRLRLSFGVEWVAPDVDEPPERRPVTLHLEPVEEPGLEDDPDGLGFR
ncbi:MULTISPECIES: hypothetical protein [Aphanothece]|uniref:hypothetical protein n=1 Tax=Aphanothece TaxID=1121 RepID=UPI0039852842